MRKFKINIDGKSYEVEVEEVTEGVQDISKKVKPPVSPSSSPVIQAPKAPVAKAAQAPAPEAPKEDKGSQGGVVQSGGTIVEAPVTGQVFKVETEVGQQVNEGQVLLILEAMKMENEVQAPVAGKVSQVLVSPGQAVDAGDTLVVIEAQ
ncbi:glutaconyl-CoA decarboxylase [Desulfitispora alkaliphila]